MRELSLAETRKLQTDVLDAVAAFCEERGINYWLNAGTLLGAVRHKGYIPWDDDIDLGMLRPDYDIFMREFNGWNPRYEFHCIENDPGFEWAFGKVMDKNTILYEEGIKRHVNIDIFVMDNAPDDDAEAMKMLKTRTMLNRLNYRRISQVFYLVERYRKRNFAARICEYLVRIAVRVFPRSYFVHKVIKLSRRYISQETKRVGDFVGIAAGFPIIGRKAFETLVELEFEGKKYKAPAGYDEWLTLLYGDYMQLPPEDQRTHHYFKAYMND